MMINKKIITIFRITLLVEVMSNEYKNKFVISKLNRKPRTIIKIGTL